MKRILMTSLAALALTAGSNAALAQDQWIYLGKKVVATNGGKDSDSIDVSDAKGAFKAIRLKAKDAYIEINNVEVLYTGAPTHNEKRTMSMNQNDNTRAINPSSDGKFVERVTVTFKPSKEPTPTLIEVYGLQNPEGARASRPSGGASVATARPVPPAPAPAATPPPVAAAPAATTVVPTAPTAPKRTELQRGDTNEQGDVLFGTQTVGFGVDRDVIRVGADIGKFDKVRFRVLDNDIFIRSMRVVYMDGTADEVAYNADIKANSRSRWIDLKADRFIKEIQMIYNSKPNFKGRAFVEVYGQYAEGWLGPNGEGKKFNQGFVLLGGQSAGFTIDRNDKIVVGRNEGGFRKIRVNVLDEAITLFEVRVIYGNGEVDIIPANRTRVDAGGSFGPIELKGGSRIIQEIRPTYRTRIFQQGDRIALDAIEPRDAARMLVVRPGAALDDRIVRDLPDLLAPGDALVLNNTRVIPAALTGLRVRNGVTAKVAFNLIKRLDGRTWRAFARPAKRLASGDRVVFTRGDVVLDADVVAKGEAGEADLAFALADVTLDAAIAAVGDVPLPPYIALKRKPDEADAARYQTVFAEKPGAVAAPTAGLHMTSALLDRLAARGVSRHVVTLHVGAGTFLPVKAEDTRDHVMHAEWCEVGADTAAALNAVRARGGRIVALGTTALRVLESAADATGRIQPYRGDTSIFITPGYQFRAVDVLMTNFHLPRSTLFMLVSAFSGLEAMRAAYSHAIAGRYRFYSYGDGSLLFRA